MAQGDPSLGKSRPSLLVDGYISDELDIWMVDGSDGSRRCRPAGLTGPPFPCMLHRLPLPRGSGGSSRSRGDELPDPKDDSGCLVSTRLGTDDAGEAVPNMVAGVLALCPNGDLWGLRYLTSSVDGGCFGLAGCIGGLGGGVQMRSCSCTGGLLRGAGGRGGACLGWGVCLQVTLALAVTGGGGVVAPSHEDELLLHRVDVDVLWSLLTLMMRPENGKPVGKASFNSASPWAHLQSLLMHSPSSQSLQTAFFRNTDVARSSSFEWAYVHLGLVHLPSLSSTGQSDVALRSGGPLRSSGP